MQRNHLEEQWSFVKENSPGPYLEIQSKNYAFIHTNKIFMRVKINSSRAVCLSSFGCLAKGSSGFTGIILLSFNTHHFFRPWHNTRKQNATVPHLLVFPDCQISLYVWLFNIVIVACFSCHISFSYTSNPEDYNLITRHFLIFVLANMKIVGPSI